MMHCQFIKKRNVVAVTGKLDQSTHIKSER